MRPFSFAIVAALAAISCSVPLRAETPAESCARTASDGNVDACRAAVALDGRDLASRKGLALAYLSLGDAEDCFRAHDEILKLAPDDPDSHYVYAAALATFGRYEDGTDQIRIALRLNPDDLPTVQLAALLFELTHQDEAAVAAFRRGAELGDPLLMFDLATAYARGRGTPPDAAASFEWLRHAAEKGHVTAMEMISAIYRDGIAGVPADPQQAAYWAERARREGLGD